MTKYIAIGLAALMLSGCAYADLIRQAVSAKGAETSRQLFQDSIWVICKATPVGTIKWWIGNSNQRAMAYHLMCSEPSAPADLFSTSNPPGVES